MFFWFDNVFVIMGKQNILQKKHMIITVFCHDDQKHMFLAFQVDNLRY